MVAVSRGRSTLTLAVTMSITKVMSWIVLLCVFVLSVPLLSAYGYSPVRLVVVLAVAKQTDDRPDYVGDRRQSPQP